jgi:hypothetical protein
MQYKNLLFTLSILCSIKVFSQGLNFNSVIQLGGKANDNAYSITTDVYGNIYVVGALNDTTDLDPGPAEFTLCPRWYGLYIAKYTGNGNFLWAKKIEGGGYGIICNAISSGKSGDIYLTGSFNGSVDFDPGPGEHYEGYPGYGFTYILKLGSNGEFRWAHALYPDESSPGNAIEIDNDENVLIGGMVLDAVDFDSGPGWAVLPEYGNGDAFVLKLNKDGEFVWAKRFGSAYGDAVESIATDSEGNVYSTGWFSADMNMSDNGDGYNLSSMLGWNVFVCKHSRDGKLCWARSFPGYGGYDMGFGIALDENRNLYIAGTFQGYCDFDPSKEKYELQATGYSDAFVCKLDNDGNFVWAVKGVCNGSMTARTITYNNGLLFVTGEYSGSALYDEVSGSYKINSNDQDAFVWALDETGKTKWTEGFGNFGIDGGNEIVADESGNVWVCGYFQDFVDFDPTRADHTLYSNGGFDGFLLKMNYDVTGIKNHKPEAQIKIYPNPAKQLIYVDCIDLSSSTKAVIYDESGKAVFTEKLEKDHSEFDLSRLKNGVYFLKTDEGEKSRMIKVIRE